MTFLLALVASFIVASAGNASQDGVLEIHYEGFTVWVDCGMRSPVLFHYVAEADGGSLPRASGYAIDPEVPLKCQPTSTDTFQSVLERAAPRYDVGHMVPANHFDHSETAITQTNFWTNLQPQTASMNRGAWLETEFIIECLRDETAVEVWGGPIWAGNAHDDYFHASHSVRTPSAFWKVAIRSDNREAQAWIIPNGEAPAISLDQWLVSVWQIEVLTGQGFDVADRAARPDHSWAHQAACHS